MRGVVDLYHGLLTGDDDLVVHAYETWGFKRLNRELIDILNIWARFIYGPLLDDRVRSLADGVKPAEYGRREAFRVHQALKQKGPVTVPREFVFMDRAAIGLGAVFLHLRAELNFYRLFNEAIEDFSVDRRGRAAGRGARRGRACKPRAGDICAGAVRAHRRAKPADIAAVAVALRGNCANPPPVRSGEIAEDRMADHGQVEIATAEGNDLPEHEATYERFVHLVFVGARPRRQRPARVADRRRPPATG